MQFKYSLSIDFVEPSAGDPGLGMIVDVFSMIRRVDEHGFDLSIKPCKLHMGLCFSGGRDLFFSIAHGFKSYCTLLSPPRYLTCSLGLQDVQWTPRISYGARKLIQIPRVIKKKKSCKPYVKIKGLI